MKDEMTWAQFKEHIDNKLKEMGLSDDIRVGYIDVYHPDDRITIDENIGGGVNITQGY